MTNLAAYLDTAARDHGQRTALRFDGTAMTYGELWAAAAAVADELGRTGVKAGDRVGLVLPNVPAFVAAFYGALSAGAVVVPMNPMLKAREMDFFVRDAGISLIYAWNGAPEAALEVARTTGVACHLLDDLGPRGSSSSRGHEAVPRADHETAVILYTSGTTGRSKGAELSHGNLASNARTTARSVLELTDADVVMGCLPLFHVFGLTCGLNASVITGACLTLVARFDPARVLHTIQSDSVTVFEGVPTMYAAMLHHPHAASNSLPSLRTCISGGSAMPMEIMTAFERTFGCQVFEGYGLSETSPVAAFNQPGHPRKPGSIGLPIPGCRMRLVDDGGHDVGAGERGEIAIRGENVMKGYWNLPEATREAIPDGWLRTGDIATRDADGYYYIVDRKKDVIIRGGYNVYPREIEEVLYEHPAVAETAVVGIKDEELGEEVGAAVVLKAGQHAEADELREFVRARVAAYKYPRLVWITDAVPKGPTGKILRRAVEVPGGTRDRTL